MADSSCLEARLCPAIAPVLEFGCCHCRYRRSRQSPSPLGGRPACPSCPACPACPRRVCRLCPRRPAQLFGHRRHPTESASAPHSRSNCKSRFGELLVWIYVLGLMHTSFAAPPRPSTRNMDAQPLWINPCGGGNVVESPSQDDGPVNNKDLFEPVELQARTALSDAEKLKRDYIKRTFKVEFEDHHKSWKHVNYKWLPNSASIPKELGQEVTTEHLKQVETKMESTFAELYADLQRIAVGLEQVVHDNNGHSKKIFVNAKYFLKEVLCEIHVLMNFRGYARKADITRDEMSDEFRSMSSESDRNLRDWIIFREYMNSMEYVAQLFQFFGSLPQ